MNLKQLLKIKEEVDRFNKVLDGSIELSRSTKGYCMGISDELYDVFDISRTHQCGHLKREWLSLKYNLNKLI